MLQFLKRLGYLCVLVFLSSLSSAAQPRFARYTMLENTTSFLDRGPWVAQTGPYDIFKSTRPDHFSRTSNLQVHDGCGAPGCRCFKSISDDDSFSARINALRCIFKRELLFQFTDSTDNCCSFCLEFWKPWLSLAV